MKFFTFSQNNSGGSFDSDEQAGIGHYVIIEANDEHDAYDRAEQIGLYFNGVDDGRDCECCGDRWSHYADENDVPKIYGTDVSNLKYETSYSWGIPSFIHYANGSFKKIEETVKERK